MNKYDNQLKQMILTLNGCGLRQSMDIKEHLQWKIKSRCKVMPEQLLNIMIQLLILGHNNSINILVSRCDL